MNITGILMECNPPHRGHRYLIGKAREMTGADYCVVVMSGDFVQRGEPAVTDKYTRARILLEDGADLVLELPLYAAAGSAAYFAECGIRLMAKLGAVGHMAFGIQCADPSLPEEAARCLVCAENESPDYRRELRRLLNTGLSFPAARARALLSSGILKESGNGKALAALLDAPSPNDQLSVDYCRVIQSAEIPIIPVPVPRIPSAHASDLRAALLSEAGPAGRGGNVPSGISLLPVFGPDLDSEKEAGILEESFRKACPLGFADFGDMLLYRLWSEPDLTVFFDVSDSLASRIGRLLPMYRDPDSFSLLLKTRNLTYTRIRRALLHILLDVRSEDVISLTEAGWAGYARVLGVRKDAGALLKKLDEVSDIPLIYRPARDAEKIAPRFRRAFEQDLSASELYALTARMKTNLPGSSGGVSVKEASRRLLRV